MFHGVKTLVQLILRRDRLKLPLWTLGIVASLLSMVPLLQQTYGDEKSLGTLYQTFSLNSAGLFLTGPMNMPTLGGLMTIETLIWWGLIIAFVNTFFITRHTRHNEEIGAQELILSGQTHRSSALTSSLLVAAALNIVIGLSLGLGLSLFGDIWGNGSGWLYGFGMAVFGILWASIAAIVVQLVQSGRSANSLLAGLVGLGFLLRGIGDFMGTTASNGILQPSWVSLLSPFGWLQRSNPLTAPNWAALIAPILISALFILVAYTLLSRRDIGLGILPARLGKKRATALLKAPFGLSIYLQRNIFIGWSFGILSMAAVIGLLVSSMTKVYGSSENLKAMITSMGGEGALVPSFLSAMLSILAIMTASYLVHGISRQRSEEVSGHLENLLSTRLSRLRWSLSHILITLISGLVLLALTGSIMAICVNISSDFTVSILDYALAGVAFFPALLFFAGLYMLCFGLIPRLSGMVAWLYFGIAIFMSWLAPLLQIDDKYMRISVFHHIPSLPLEAFDWPKITVIVLISLLAILVGLAFFRRRNIISS